MNPTRNSLRSSMTGANAAASDEPAPTTAMPRDDRAEIVSHSPP